MPGTLFVVATPIGNLEDISARALRILKEVAVIAAEDTRRTAHLLARYAIRTPTTSLHEHNEHQKTPVLLGRLAAGESVALVSDAGTPLVSDPGQRLVRAAIAEDVPVEAIPGPSAVITALVASGFPADTFLFLGFPPTKPGARAAWFESLAGAGRTVVFFESPHRVLHTLGEMAELLPSVSLCVARELTKSHGELVRGPISAVLETLPAPRGEYTIVADVGRKTDPVPAARPAGSQLLAEFGELTNNSGLSRRQALAKLGQRYSMSVNQVYKEIELARK